MYKVVVKGLVPGMLAIFLLLCTAVGVAEEIKTDASGHWRYVLEDHGAKIVSWGKAENADELAIPEMLDGYMVTCLGENIFDGCRFLESVRIPSGVTSIEKNPFAGYYCSLGFIDVSPENLRYGQIDGVLFDKQEKTLVAYPIGRDGMYSIPEGVTTIGDDAFWGCAGLTGITLPDSVTSIGDGAFIYCGVSDLNIPNGVVSIGDWAFNESSLIRVTISDSVTSIGKYAFSHCYGLTSVTIPDSVIAIGEWAFAGCDNLILHVTKESVAAIYAQENDIPYVLVTK